jgi:uncharacterized membrane protein YidH (DUF202 family)
MTVENVRDVALHSVFPSFILEETVKETKGIFDGEEVTFVTPGAILAGFTETESFTLQPGEKKSRRFELKYPKAIESGQYRLRGSMVTITGDTLGSVTHSVQLNGTGVLVEVDVGSCRLIVDGMEFLPNDGPNLFKDEQPQISCRISNLSNESITIVPAYRIGEFYVFGYPQSKWKELKGDSVQLNPKETRVVEMTIPFNGEPQVYNGGLQFTSKEGSIISPFVFFRWVVKGSAARIDEINIDKDIYLSGESAQVFIRFFPSPDLYWQDTAVEQEDSSATSRLSGSELMDVKVHLSIINASGQACGSAEHLLGAFPNIDTAISETLAVPIRIDCIDPVVSVSLTEAGEQIAGLEYKTKSSAMQSTSATSNKQVNTNILILVGALIIVTCIVVLVVLNKNRQKRDGMPPTVITVLLLVGVLIAAQVVSAAVIRDTPETGMRFGVRLSPDHVLQSGTTMWAVGEYGAPPIVNFGDPIMLEWRIPGAPANCNASGSLGWSGAKANSGSQAIPAPVASGTYTFNLNCDIGILVTKVIVANPGEMMFNLRSVFTPKGRMEFRGSNAAILPSGTFSEGSVSTIQVDRLLNFGGSLCDNDYPRSKIITYVDGVPTGDIRIFRAEDGGAYGAQEKVDTINIDVSSWSQGTYTIRSEFYAGSVLKEWVGAPTPYAGLYSITDPPACPCRPGGLYTSGPPPVWIEPNTELRCKSSNTPDAEIDFLQNSAKCVNFVTPPTAQSDKDAISFATYPNPIFDESIITVLPPGNTPNIITAGDSHTVQIGDAHTHILAEVQDIDNNLAGYTWVFTSCPGGLALCPTLTNDNGMLSDGASPVAISGPTYTPTQLGDYVLELTVTDLTSLYTQQTITDTAVSSIKPSTPTGLTASMLCDSGAINLSWAHDGLNTDDYHIYRCANPPDGALCTPIVPTASVSQLSFLDTGLTNGVNYRYRVTAHKHSGDVHSEYSNTAESSYSCPPTLKISAERSRVFVGQTATLYWKSEGADDCSVVGPEGILESPPGTLLDDACVSTPFACNNNSGYETIPIIEDREYVFECSNAVGSKTDSIEIQVATPIFRDR